MRENNIPTRQRLIDIITKRAWQDKNFRRLLFDDPLSALRDQFGDIPVGFEAVSFRRCEVDRAVVKVQAGNERLSVRPKLTTKPLNALTRTVFGVHELVVVFYTKRCQYQCSFCTLPSTSALGDVSSECIAAQLDYAFSQEVENLNRVQQVSLGNEGSILDERTFPRDQLEYVLRRCAQLPNVREIVLETRSEFIAGDLLDSILSWIHPCELTMKIGLESADDHIRQQILGKRMNRIDFENVLSLFPERGIKLASYVLLKADPKHNDARGRQDALATCDYLKNVCRKHGIALTLRINSMYKAENSVWARWAEAANWEPPSVFDIAEVMLAAKEPSVAVFAGLYDEGLATRDGHYEVRPDFEQWAMETLDFYNQTGDQALLAQVAGYRNEKNVAI